MKLYFYINLIADIIVDGILYFLYLCTVRVCQHPACMIDADLCFTIGSFLRIAASRCVR